MKRTHSGVFGAKVTLHHTPYCLSTPTKKTQKKFRFFAILSSKGVLQAKGRVSILANNTPNANGPSLSFLIYLK